MEKIIGYTSVDKTNTQSLSGLELAKRDLANHFAIRKGEKWTNPEFGSDLPYFVFQPLDQATIQAINDDVDNVVRYDPRFTLMNRDTRVETDEHYVTVTVELMYEPTKTPTDLELKFDSEAQDGIEFI
mgnify:CR=1 FL=1